MMRVLLFVVCACFFLPSLAAADEPEHDEEWLVELRHSGSYKKGMEQVREPACAGASKAWSEALLNRLGKQVESHGLPVGKKPE